jgi:hypothetical protein
MVIIKKTIEHILLICFHQVVLFFLPTYDDRVV